MRTTNAGFGLMLFIGLLAASCEGDEGTGGGAGSGTIRVQISGEELGTDGFKFPQGSEVVLADGWEISFEHVFVTVGRVWFAENPDQAPADQSQFGEVVAEMSGPWAVDLSKGGDVPGAGGEGMAVKLFDIDEMNKKGGSPFAADQRYAFNYDVVAATSAATRVNFATDASATQAYDALVADGCAVAYIGTATFKGGTSCEVSDPVYDFSAIPTTVPFTLCFKSPAEYLNCQNQENQGDPFPDEEFQRGIPIKTNDASIAQITFHLDHPFFSDVEHEPTLYFDQFAAQLVGAAPGTQLTLDALSGLDFTAFVDGAGQPLPWRRCDGEALPSGSARAFESGSIPVGAMQEPSQGLRDYADYVLYVQSSQGHLNGGEGLCYTSRKYPSPQ